MKKYEIINQLKSIAEYAEDNIDLNDRENSQVWRDDIEACTKAIRIIRKDKKADEHFWKGIVLGELIISFMWLVYTISNM